MPPNKIRVFLDTSVIFSAVFSPSGGARMIFRLAEAGALQIILGQSVIREADEVVRRKAPASLPDLARLLSFARVEVRKVSATDHLATAGQMVSYLPDVHVLAEALAVQPDWFITHDKEHFLRNEDLQQELPFRVGTPGDLLQHIKHAAQRGGKDFD